MKTALFVMMPLPSHFFAGFNLARQLQARGYRIVFAGQDQLRASVEKEGFTFRSLLYATEFRSMTPKVWLGLLLKSIFDQTYIRSRYRYFCREVFSFHAVEEEVKPNLVVIDSCLSFYALLLRSEVSRMIINTKLSMYPSPGIPPLESVRISVNSHMDRLIAALGWLQFRKDYHLTTLVRKAALLNYDETYFYKRFMRRRVRENLFGKHSLDSQHPALRTIPKVITYPRALEYGWKQSFQDEWYIEMPFERDESAYRTEEYDRVLSTVLKRKASSPDQQYLVYCSLGTLTGVHVVRTSIYLEKVIKGLSDQSHILLIIATVNSNVKSTDAGNVYLLNKVPQLDLLRHCDLMITHGGLNSMTECLQMGVPMLAAPLFPRSDHCGNVARIEANGFGLGGDMLTDSPEQIRAKALRILNDPHYRERVRNVRLQTRAEQERLLDQLLETTLAKVK